MSNPYKSVVAAGMADKGGASVVAAFRENGSAATRDFEQKYLRYRREESFLSGRPKNVLRSDVLFFHYFQSYIHVREYYGY